MVLKSEWSQNTKFFEDTGHVKLNKTTFLVKTLEIGIRDW